MKVVFAFPEGGTEPYIRGCGGHANFCKTTQNKTRQHKTRQHKTRQDMTRNDKTTQDTTPKGT